MYIKENDVCNFVLEIGSIPQEKSTICAQLKPVNVSTGFSKFMDSMMGKNEFNIIHFAEKEIVMIPVSWYTLQMKKKEYRTIPYDKIKHITELEAKTLNYVCRVETDEDVFELVIRDENLTASQLTTAAALKGEWYKENMPVVLEKMSQFR